MKAICVKTYFDNELQRTVSDGEEVELTEERFDKLSTGENDAKMILVKAAEETVVKKEEPKKKG